MNPAYFVARQLCLHQFDGSVQPLWVRAIQQCKLPRIPKDRPIRNHVLIGAASFRVGCRKTIEANATNQGSCQKSNGKYDAEITNEAPLFVEPCCQLCEHTLQRTRTVTKLLNRTTHNLSHGYPEVGYRGALIMLIVAVEFQFATGTADDDGR